MEEACWLSIASLDSGRVLCRANVHSKSAEAAIRVSWSPCGTKIILTRGDIAQLYYCPMREPSYNPISLLRTFKGSYGAVRHCDWTAESEVLVLGSDDSKCRVYPVPRINKMPNCTTLIGCRAAVMGCWLGGKTGMDVLAIDQDGLVCTWQTDFAPDELELDFKRTRTQMFAPNVYRRHLIKREPESEPEIEPQTEEEIERIKESDEEESESEDDSSDEEIERIKYRRTHKDFINQKGERASPVVAADFHKGLNLLACAHANGLFSLHEINWAADASEYGSFIQVRNRYLFSVLSTEFVD